jgi:hypothetical protein
MLHHYNVATSYSITRTCTQNVLTAETCTLQYCCCTMHLLTSVTLPPQGAFVDAMLERMLALGTPPEFVMAMGDEASDEIMFTGVENFKVNCTTTSCFLVQAGISSACSSSDGDSTGRSSNAACARRHHFNGEHMLYCIHASLQMVVSMITSVAAYSKARIATSRLQLQCCFVI